MGESTESTDQAEETTFVRVSTVPPPSWETPEEAIAYLGGEFADLLEAGNDLVMMGCYVPADFFFDLAAVAQALSSYLQNPRPLEVQDESAVCVDTLARCVLELREKIRKGWEHDTVHGCSHEFGGGTLPILAGALANAARQLEVEAGHRFDHEQRRLRKVNALHRAAAKFGCELRDPTDAA